MIEETSALVGRSVAYAKLLCPPNPAAEVQSRVIAAEVYATLGQWEDALRHVTVALADIEACESGESQPRAPSVAGERPDPLKSTYKHRSGNEEGGNAPAASSGKEKGNPRKRSPSSMSLVSAVHFAHPIYVLPSDYIPSA